MPPSTLTSRPSPKRTVSGGSVTREGASTGRRPSNSARSAIDVERSAIRVERCPNRTEEKVAAASTSVPPVVASEAIAGPSAISRAGPKPERWDPGSAARALSDRGSHLRDEVEGAAHQPVSERALARQHPDLPRECEVGVVDGVAGDPTV